MATKKQDKPVEAFILRDCVFGKAGDVVELSEADAEIGKLHGMLDLHPAAVKAAKK
ncbi:hypothetical protein [Methylibium sp.]|uniref:hypothetical protein n=1 Tax=Methylibium sp. TaxID=2067992 RepID=UPI00185C81D0|nr:hypothetical protein [Methylibium sp.]MBA3588297.1 hypothetical protein [Methylibium sp.]